MSFFSYLTRSRSNPEQLLGVSSRKLSFSLTSHLAPEWLIPFTRWLPEGNATFFTLQSPTRQHIGNYILGAGRQYKELLRKLKGKTQRIHACCIIRMYHDISWKKGILLLSLFMYDIFPLWVWRNCTSIDINIPLCSRKLLLVQTIKRFKPLTIETCFPNPNHGYYIVCAMLFSF